ncbi:hypothetical protein [Gordonia aichiensis]|uniref:hypothetical protein n=1 Tax=Gordonia aichiensis TaxID=36820 RepID=UPI00326475AF
MTSHHPAEDGLRDPRPRRPRGPRRPRRQRGPRRPRPRWLDGWPLLPGLLLALLIGLDLDDGRSLAPILTASGFVYVATAALGRGWLAWPAFGLTFVVIVVGEVIGVNPTPVLLGLAAVLVVGVGVGDRGGVRTVLLLESAALAVLGAAALLVARSTPAAGGLIVASLLVGHAAWDVVHHRMRIVVTRPFAAFCAALDIGLAILIAWSLM